MKAYLDMSVFPGIPVHDRKLRRLSGYAPRCAISIAGPAIVCHLLNFPLDLVQNAYALFPPPRILISHTIPSVKAMCMFWSCSADQRS